MCLFPLPNNDIFSVAYKKGVTEFDCGACPECLRKRSNSWALRSVYEAKSYAHNCMITLTYDNFKRDCNGNIVYVNGIPQEEPVNPFLCVDKRHIQLFIKRLRKWYSKFAPGELIKYICCAEYGSTTHRAHYHLILFNVRFPDIHFYKRSKRGNIIYMSSILTKLWGKGICTVDSIRVLSSVARYCTKYCAKERSDQTFMLCSQNIGIDNLLKEFNGKSYFIDGREYTIPRSVWQKYIISKYPQYPDISYKYINRKFDESRSEVLNYDEFCAGNHRRAAYRAVRDCDSVYRSYLAYWKYKGEQFTSRRPSVRKRIYLLDESRYHFYKIKALAVLDKRENFIPYPAPGSGCISAYERFKQQTIYHGDLWRSVHLPRPSRPNRASDTKYSLDPFFYELYRCDLKGFKEISVFKPLTRVYEQCILDLGFS